MGFESLERTREMQGKDVLGKMPRQKMWESRVDQKTMKEVGVKSPDGKYIPLSEGKSFAVIRDFEKKTYRAVIKDSAGNIVEVLEEGNLND